MPKPNIQFTPEAREAAAQELMDLADRMFRGGQSLMRKAARLIEGDPTKDSMIIGAITRYQDQAMPAFNEVARIEAILRGTPPEKCLSEGEKRRREKERQSEKEYERRRIRDQEEWAEFYAWKRDKFWADREKAERAGMRKVEATEDGIIHGPWGEA